MKRSQTIPRFSVDYRPGDFLAALPWLFSGGPPANSRLCAIVGNRPSFWTASGRQALWLILKALALKPGAGVAVPLYCDLSVAEAIKAAGCTPVFVDINEDSLTMSPESLLRVRATISAVVVPHFFGQVAHMPEILEIAKPLPVIEDTAHAPLSFLRGRPVGTFGVACFYSFGSTKPWPAGGGGLAVVNEARLADSVACSAKALSAVGFRQKSGNFVGQAAKAVLFRRPFYGWIGQPLRARAENHRLLEPNLDTTAIQPHQAAIVLRQTPRLADCLERQRRNSLRLLALLAQTPGLVLPKERPGVRYNYHMFPVLLSDSAEKQAVAAKMLAACVDTSQVYWNLLAGASALGYQGGCPVSESAAGRMLTLPNHFTLSDTDIARIARVFTEALQDCRLQRPLVPVPLRQRAEPLEARSLGTR